MTLTSESQSRLIKLGDQYKINEPTVVKLQQRLKLELLATFPSAALSDALHYCQDKVTVFRFLLACNYDHEEAFQRMLDTVHWRLSENVDQLTWQLFPTWLEKGFAFYHKYDQCGQPLVVVRLRHFPIHALGGQWDEGNGQSIQSYVCYMMELARRWMYRDMCQKESQQRRQQPYCNDDNDTFLSSVPLIKEISVIVDLAQAPFVPLNRDILAQLSHVVQHHYPEMVGNIYVLNFGILHQSIWQVIKKFLISESTKNRIIFTTKDQLAQIIPKENLLQELGGSDDYEWDIQSNWVLNEFDVKLQNDILPPSPELTPLQLSETSLDQYDDTEYCDDDDDDDNNTGDINSSTEEDLLEASNRDNCLQQQYDHQINPTCFGPVVDLPKCFEYFGIRKHRQLGLRMRSGFLSSYFVDDSPVSIHGIESDFCRVQQEKQDMSDWERASIDPDTVDRNDHNHAKRQISATDRSTQTVIASALLPWYRPLCWKSFCWMILYLVLRIPIESAIYHCLIAAVAPEHLLTLTISLTSVIAMVGGFWIISSSQVKC